MLIVNIYVKFVSFIVCSIIICFSTGLVELVQLHSPYIKSNFPFSLFLNNNFLRSSGLQLTAFNGPCTLAGLTKQLM